jgi:hypothetical protein
MLLSAMSGQLPGATYDSAIRSVVLANMLQQCPLLNYAQFYSHTGNADEIQLSADDYNENLDTRLINTEFAEDLLGTPNYTTTGLRIFGFKAKSDLAWNAREPNGAFAHHGREIIKYSQSIGRSFMDRFINDVASPTTFDGLKALTTAAGRVFDFGGANGDVLATDDTAAAKKSARAFVELMNFVESEVIGSGTKLIIAPNSVINRLSGIGLPYLSLSNTADFLGQAQTLRAWNGIPIIPAGKKANLGQQVIPSNEVMGTSTDATSVYVVIFSERDDLTFNSNIGMMVQGAYLKDNWITTRAELQTGLALVNKFAVARIQGIRVTA